MYRPIQHLWAPLTKVQDRFFLLKWMNLKQRDQLHFSYLDSHRLSGSVCTLAQKARLWWRTIRPADGVCSVTTGLSTFSGTRDSCFRFSLEAAPSWGPWVSSCFQGVLLPHLPLDGLYPPPAWAPLRWPVYLVVLSEHMLGWRTLTPLLLFSLVEFCPLDLLTTSSLSLLWVLTAHRLADSIQSSLPGFTFKFLIIPGTSSKVTCWSWVREMISTQAKLILLPRFEAQIILGSKAGRKKKISEMHKYSACWLWAGQLTVKTWFKGDTAGITVTFPPNSFSSLDF